jgi:RNA recognition motif-containing protein
MELNLEQQHEGLSFSAGLKDFGRKLLNFLFYLITSVLSILGWSKKSSHDPELTEIHSKSPDHQEQFATSAGTSPIAPSSIASENVLENLKEMTIQAENESCDVVPRTADVTLPEPAADETKNTLVIKNLPFKFSKQELDDLLMKYDAKSKNVRMMKDGQGRFTGIVFIRCPSKDEAAKLIISMNTLEIGGRNIQVEFKKKKKKKATANSTEVLSSDSEMSAPPSLRSTGEVSLESIKPNNLVMSQDSQKCETAQSGHSKIVSCSH